MSALVKEFQQILGKDNVFTGEAERLAYSYDAAVLPGQLPWLVVRPLTEQALSAAIKLAYQNGLPITVRGSGTNLAGATVPQGEKSIVILTNALNKILEINKDDLYAVVQPGVITTALAAKVAQHGMFYPPDPGSQNVSTLGGNIACNAGGLRGLKYGVTKDYVMGLEIMDHNGETVKTGSRTVKCVTGYNMAGLMVASEGTLGIISRAILKLVPPPKASKAMLASFASVEDASQVVADIIAAHIVPCTLELLDQNCIRHIEAFTHAGLPLDAGAILLIEVDGSHLEPVEDETEQIRRICAQHNSQNIQIAKDETEKNKLWEARRNALPALARARPTTVLEDATVPRSKIPAMVSAVNAIAARYKLDIATFGHAGDGNLHPTILYDRRDEDESKRVEQAVNEIFETAIKLQGTLSGEHGIGLAKVRWMEQETNRATIEFSKRLRTALDPKGLFNPGKKVV